MDKEINYYRNSRRIVGVMAVILAFIALINEDISVKAVVISFVYIVAWATSYLTVPVSKKIIRFGDGVAGKGLRVLFYIAILPLTLLIAYILYALILMMFGQIEDSVNAAVITVFLCVATTVMVIVPYAQALIVLMLRRKVS